MSGTTSNTNMPLAVPANGGANPRGLSAAQKQTLATVTAANANSGATLQFLYDGSHVGTDLVSLGTAVSSGQGAAAFSNQTATDLAQLMSDYMKASPGIMTGVQVNNGASVAIPPLLFTNLVADVEKASTLGNATLDKSYGAGLSSFFHQEQVAFLGAAASPTTSG